MSETLYNEEHLWVRRDDYGMTVVGISEHAQEQLGDIVYVELPDVGREVLVDEEIGLIESVKTTSEINAPVSGTILEINEALAERPEVINESPLDDGWLLRIEPDGGEHTNATMGEDDYKEFVDLEV
jgi:glycine cleavage system H protein